MRTITLSYDIRSRVNSINTAGSITTLVNDAIGNLSQTTDPNQQGQGTPKKTTHTYDALNRLTQTVDVLSGNTTYQYNTHNQLTQVTAPNATTTSYIFDDLNNRLTEVSPDRGTTAYVHNTAGQVTSITDARNITVTYSYDALNRITQANYPGTSEDITYTYDTCTNGKTRLCGTTDQSGTTAYEFDATGNITQVTRAINSVNYVTQYAYDQRDQITTITYPDGRSVTYTRDPLSRITKVETSKSGATQTLTQTLTYRADGLMTTQTFGNGLTETRAYDTQGRVTGITQDDHTDIYTYDANSNVTSRGEAPDPLSYTYDAKDRLLTISSPWDSHPFTYDINDNRASSDGAPYQYQANSNRLSNAAGQPFQYDAAGNVTLLDWDMALSYNNQGRMSQVSHNGVSTTYQYNAQGLRTHKIGATTTIYHYDLAGNLILETDTSGTPQKAYVWRNTIPVAQIEGSNIYYIRTDHLNTPRTATDQAQSLVWEWPAEAFGTEIPYEEGTTINLRFPGQYYDSETGLHYNWNRYYMPHIGRYITSDPIGLEGGLNTYGYVDANPLRWVDYLGLVTLPAPGRVTSEFGRRPNPTGQGREFHAGVDFSNPVGAPIACTDSGRIVRVRQNQRGLANSVTVQHDDGTAASYSHVRSNLRVGDRVREGQYIGVTDLSGRSTGGHLHYEFFEPGRRVSPTPHSLSARESGHEGR